MAVLDETYGLHELVLEDCDEYIGETFVASPADANGRGILFRMQSNGEDKKYMASEFAAAVKAIDKTSDMSGVQYPYLDIPYATMNFNFLYDLGGAVRSKTGQFIGYRPSDMAKAIRELRLD